MDSSAQLKQRRLWYETLDMRELWKSIHYIVLCRPGRREKEKKTTAENDISSLTLHYNVHGDINKLITCSVLLDLKRDCDSLYIYQDQALLFLWILPTQLRCATARIKYTASQCVNLHSVDGITLRIMYNGSLCHCCRRLWHLKLLIF